MSVSRPGGFGAGDEIRLAGATYAVNAVLAEGVALQDVTGRISLVRVGRLLADASFSVVTMRKRVPLPPTGMLDGLPDEVVARARWWERHIVELLTGLAPQAASGSVGDPVYDPGSRSLRQREMAKVAELERAGCRVAFSTVQRLRRAYEAEGLWGLVDRRYAAAVSPTGRVDSRVVDAVRQAVAEETNRSTGTVGRLRRRVEQVLHARHGAQSPPMPSRTTFYRLVERLSTGRHTFGSARTRRSLAKQPDGPFGTVTVARPGEWVQIDSTPLDVRVVLTTGWWTGSS